MSDVGGTGEFSVNVEVEMDIKDETQEDVSVPLVKTEHEVRFWGVHFVSVFNMPIE
jgi:hypothetical protein